MEIPLVISSNGPTAVGLPLPRPTGTPPKEGNEVEFSRAGSLRRMERMEHDGMEQTASRSLCVCEDADTSMTATLLFPLPRPSARTIPPRTQ